MKNLARKFKWKYKNPYLQYNDLNKVIFIHIPKTAGISVANSLFSVNHGHFKAAHYKTYDSIKFKEYFKFAFVRNPWDRAVSAFLYLKGGGRNEDDSGWSKKNLQDCPDFESFALKLENNSFARNVMDWMHFETQVSYLSVNNSVAVDFVGRFETLSADFFKLTEKLKVNKSLLSSNVNKNREEYKSYYLSDKTIRIIEDLYQDDILNFHYKF